MKRLRAVTIVLAVIITVVTAQTALASWYTGNSRTSAYGIQAAIFTPSSAPYLKESGESSWVSLPSPYWVQTGWRYYKGWTAAKPYVEHNTKENYGLNHYGTQSWGSSKNYMVDHKSGNTWRAYINLDLKEEWEPTGAPKTVMGYSEVHRSSENELNTSFNLVFWRKSSGEWRQFDQARWREDDPYAVEKTHFYEYRNYGPTK